MVLKIPALALGIIEGLSFKGRCYSSLAQMLGTRSPMERLAHLLLHLMDLYGVEERGGTLIAASFTHADLSHMVGVTRQWVTTTLKRLSEMGVLISSRDGYHRMKAKIRQIADVSGAGDTVISVAAACLAAGIAPQDIANIANIAGGLVCEQSGVVPIDKELLLSEIKLHA